MGHSYRSAATYLFIIIPFFFSTWEEYHTGVLYLGYINGPTEGLLIACILQLTSAIAGIQTINHYIIIFFSYYTSTYLIIIGPEWWSQDLRDLFGNSVPSFIPKDWTSADILLVALGVSVFTFHVPAR